MIKQDPHHTFQWPGRRAQQRHRRAFPLLTPGPRGPPAISLGCKTWRADPYRPPDSHSAPCLPCTVLPRGQRVTQGLGYTRKGGVSVRLSLGSPRKTTCLKGHEVVELLGAGRQLLVRGRCDTAQRAIGICGRGDGSVAALGTPVVSQGRAWERGDGSAAAPGLPVITGKGRE